MAGCCTLVEFCLRGSIVDKRVIELGEGEHRIGRNGACEVVLTGDKISRFHAVLTVGPHSARIDDSCSTHGTLINGVRSGTHELRPGDCIGLPNVLLAVLQIGARQAPAWFLVDTIGHHRDGLTRALNKRALRFELADRCARPPAPGFSLIVCNIDRFKRINDVCGHGPGDHILEELAARLMREVPPGKSLVSRSGGDEFTVMIDEVTRDQALDLAERLRQAVEREPFASVLESGCSDEAIRWPAVTVSLGVVVVEGSTTLDETALLGAAEEACYQAKCKGRNRVVLGSL